MRLRQLVLACGLTSLVLSPYASALGLGEVKLKSTLNQPLEAEVKLLDTRDLTEEQILVALASPADFERNGVDRLFFYTEFQFRVDLAAADGPKVVITSRSAVREPYLNFLIEARWTAGRLLREYTLLMDLPTFDDSVSTQAVQAAATSTFQQQQPATSSSGPNKASSSVEMRQAPVSRQSSPSLSGDEYEVRSNDTLWEIALRARPDSSVSVHQSMMALYRANPEAFINGNINRLRRGQVLRIPDTSEMKSLDKSVAVNQFAQATGDTESGAQLSTSRRSNTSPSESTESTGRVKLAAPSAGAASAGQGSGANDGSGKALEAELAVTLEELDKSKAENTELSSRVKDLEAQIQTMERLVEVSNEKLRALQVSAGQSAVDTSVAPMPETTKSAESATEVASVGSSQAAASSVAPAMPPQPTPPKKVIVPPKPEPTIVDRVVDSAPWIGLGLLGLAGAGYVVYRRRKQAGEQAVEEQEDVFAVEEPVDDAQEVADASDPMDETVYESSFEEESEAPAVAETGDVVGEADIYIAYGKLDQAEEMLLNGLQKDPTSNEIRMKLLEVYSQQQNAPAFDKHYAALIPLAGGALLARASELREGIAGAAEFDSQLAAATDGQDSDIDAFSLDDLDNLDLDHSAPSSAAASTEEQDSDFDLDLDLDSDEVESGLSSVGASSIDSPTFDLQLEDEISSADDADDVSELSLALDSIEVEPLPNDLDLKTTSIEDDFNFELDGAAESADPISDDHEELTLDLPDSLEVAGDDFNLDMNVDDVDLAALDHEMESLDVDFDEDLLGETAGDLELEGVDDISDLTSEDGHELEDLALTDAETFSRDFSASGLNLTDDLDKSNASVARSLDDELAEIDINDEKLALGELDQSIEDSTVEFATGEDDLLSNIDLGDDDLDLAELDQELGELSGSFEPASNEFVLDEESADIDFEGETIGHTQLTPDSLAAMPGQTVPMDEDGDQEEDLFEQALSDFSGESDDVDLNEFSSDETSLADLSDDDMDAELDFLADADEAATKLDLARAYIDMGDSEGAKDILSEVLGEGNDEQRKEANELLGRIG